MKTIRSLTLLAGFCLLLSVPSRAADTDNPRKKDKSGKTESSAPAGAELSRFQLGMTVLNEPVTLEDLKGKAVLLEFWGVNCGPCLAVMPEIVSLEKRMNKKGLRVVGLHCQQATPEQVKKTAEKLRVKFPVTTGGGGPVNSNTIPHSCIFDATGKMIFQGKPTDRDFDQALRAALKTVDPETLKKEAAGN